MSLLSKLLTAIGDLFKVSIIPLLFLVATAMFLWGIIKYLMALGTGEEPTEAKKYMAWGIISLFIILAFWGIVRLVATSLF